MLIGTVFLTAEMIRREHSITSQMSNFIISCLENSLNIYSFGSNQSQSLQLEAVVSESRTLNDPGTVVHETSCRASPVCVKANMAAGLRLWGFLFVLAWSTFTLFDVPPDKSWVEQLVWSTGSSMLCVTHNPLLCTGNDCLNGHMILPGWVWQLDCFFVYLFVYLFVWKSHRAEI